MKRVILLLLVASGTLGGLAHAATAATSQNGASMPMSRLVTSFSTFAGSTANAESLVEGLRTSSTITLVGADNTTTAFSPDTRAMGWGNVKIALALAQAELKGAGITSPTPADIEAVLNGGTVSSGNSTVTFNGVLAERASGLGWGEIARANNLNLGTVVSGLSKATGSSHEGGVNTSLRGHGIVTAGGSASRVSSHGPVSTAGVVTAAGSASVANGHGSGGSLTTAHGEALGHAVTTASGGGQGPSANHGHGNGRGGG